MKSFFCAILIYTLPFLLLAQQKEILHPLVENNDLKIHLYHHPELAEEKLFNQNRASLFKSAAGNFPFIELLNYPADTLDRLNWVGAKAKKIGPVIVFDAFNENNVVYHAGNGQRAEMDELISTPINTANASQHFYVTFSYATGSTWSSGDSLLLQCRTGSGNYQTVWLAPDDEAPLTEVVLLLSPDLYASAGFNLRFVNHSVASTGNTDNFRLKYVAVSEKLDLPMYENFSAIEANPYPDRKSWFYAATRLVDGANVGIDFGHAAVFDAYDQRGQVYHNANGNSGFSDTLCSHLMDVEQFLPEDSVSLRFYYKSMPNHQMGDSLVVEFKNNVGVWQRVWEAGASSDIDTFIQQINVGRFRHPNFQFRLINKCKYTTTDTLKYVVSGFNIGHKLQLPFIEDFSTSVVYPHPAKWTSRHVYINNNFPIKPPSYNVATFDGLDMYGKPYALGGSGYCDTLTVKPINLSGYSASDSLCISFFIQPKGMAYDPPEPEDSLVLEFRTSAVNPFAYETVWSGSPVLYATTAFTQITVSITDSTFFTDDFQFRFKNIGSKTGNLDHWHVDYIRIDKGLCSANYPYKDIAISKAPVSLLNIYTSVPAKHYQANSAAYNSTQQLLSMYNNSTIGYPVDYVREVFDPTRTRVDLFTNVNPNLPGQTEMSVVINKQAPLQPQNFDGDFIIYQAKYADSTVGGTDNIPSNDTINVKTIFSNYFAYDDGSAEAGYDVKPGQGSVGPWAVALGFDMPLADTLLGIGIFFNRSGIDVTDSEFDFMVWQAINTNGNGSGETLLKRERMTGPVYRNFINGFYYHRFQTPLLLPAGKFYIGWEQTKKFELNVGFDQNFVINDEPAINQEMFFNVDGIWEPTKFKGALMMRPLLGHWVDAPVGIKENKKEKQHFAVSIYPNPAESFITIKTDNDESVVVSIYDIGGRWVNTLETITNKQIALPELSRGLYFLKIVNTTSLQITTQKLLINNQ